MYWWIPMAIGAGVGLLKNMEQSQATDQANEDDRRIAATKELWSPFSGVHGELHQKPKPSLIGDLGGGALTGLAMGQSINNAQAPAKSGAVDSSADIEGIPSRQGNLWAGDDWQRRWGGYA